MNETKHTPRTDALMKSPLVEYAHRGWKAAVVNHARQLEHEHAALLAALSKTFVGLQTPLGAAFRDMHPATWREIEAAIAQATGSAAKGGAK